ncbi:hypothetical protein [Rhodoferax sp.]|uniref:hypothetical protein n=1 Tax=Rhodoferax sp. TaxID=50421 RepID=UPI0026037A24|nr:hypothetical protein [Rhodoferax sp.]MDD2920229.1 hypothetical protein [Rhodoferax sp.]
MKNDPERLAEAARVLACHCFSQVSIEGNRMAGIANWHIVCEPRIVRKSMLPVLWADLLEKAEAAQQWPMLMHIRCGDWACTSLNPWFDDWGTGFENTITQPIRDWWLFQGEEVAFPGRYFAKATTLLGLQFKRQ